MNKALFKKQMLEVFAWLYQDRKTGKRREKGNLALFAFLYIVLFGFLMGTFAVVAGLSCKPLVSIGYGWLYWALMGISAMTLGVFGSVFNTYTSLYRAKDNDLMLSMPIPIKSILLARLSGVYAIGLMYEVLVMVPVIIVYFVNAKFSLLSLIFSILITFVLSVLVLSISCILGWVVALVSSKLHNQKILTVFLSLGFIAVYYYICGSASTFLQKLLLDPSSTGQKVKGFMYPLYQMGRAAEGDVMAMLIFVAIVAAFFAVCYLVLLRSFLRLATSNIGAKKVKYVEKKGKARSIKSALLTRELKRFTGSTNYMLNCGLGIAFMPIGAAILVFKKTELVMLMSLIGDEGIIALIATAAICLIASMNDITAPSVSLEGKNIWIMQSMPVDAWEVLKAKINLHQILTLTPAAIVAAAIIYVTQFESGLCTAGMLIASIFYIKFMAAFGLILNLKMPNLKWTNEIVPIKQSACVTVALFGGWAMVLILAIVFYLLRHLISATIYLVAICVLFYVLNELALRWLKREGCEIYSNL